MNYDPASNRKCLARVCWGASCMILIAGLGGCGPKPETPTIPTASNTSYVSDIPLPTGFKIMERLSEDLVKAGRRAVKHVYQGEASAQSIKNFYQHYMPQMNWELREQSLNKGVYLLRYRKGQELCDVRVERMPTGLGAVTQVQVEIRSYNTETPG